MFFNSERIAENDAPVWDTWFNFSDLGRVRGDAKVRAAPSRPSHKGAFSRGSCRRIERRDDSAPRRALRRIRRAPPRGRGRGAVMGGAAATTTTSNRTTAPTTNSGDDRRRTDDFRPNDDDQKTTDSFPNGFAAAAALSDEGPERLRVKPRDRRAPHDARARALGHTLGVFDSYSSFLRGESFYQSMTWCHAPQARAQEHHLRRVLLGDVRLQLVRRLDCPGRSNSELWILLNYEFCGSNDYEARLSREQ